MSQPAFDITPFLHQDEGQHFDRKSPYEGTEGAKRVRDRRAACDQVAEYVAGFANAEGGVLVLGIEDDHSVTGHSLPADALASLLSTPRARLQPPQSEGFLVETQGKQLIVFDVPAADVPVQVVGDGFPLRIGDKTLQVSETQIRSLKLQGLAESWESRPATCTVADLDRELIARARQGAGLAAWSDEEFRALLHAHRNGRVENADLRSLAGMDTLAASLLLRRLRDRSLLDLHPHGANSYYTLPPTLSEATDRGEHDTDRGGRDVDRGEPARNREEHDADRGELTPEVFAAIQQLGTRPRKERLRAVIASICAQRDWTTPAELARWLNIQPANLTERHLSPMVRVGQLERRFPDTPTHAEQAYRSSGGQLPLALSREDEK